MTARGNSGNISISQVSTQTQTQEIDTGEVMPEESEGENSPDKKCRLNPLVVQKIRDIVAGGEVRVYHVRRLLR
jgi:hypothetical protein